MALEQCPSCEKHFKDIQDFPRIYVATVETLKTEDVLTALPHWWEEDLLAEPKKNWKGDLVPKDVLAYFREHPEENKLVHPDSYIYERPYRQTKEYRQQVEADPKFYNRLGVIEVGGDLWRRRFNHAPTVRTALADNQDLKEYLKLLQQKIGKEVATKELLPRWEQYFPGAYLIPNTSYRLMLQFMEADQRVNDLRIAEIGIWHDGPNLGSAGGSTIEQLLQIGKLCYEGRIHHI